ncbi:MAG TPA: hypothetical protein ENJ35_04310 [Gammaproteobacteria bacterium]|nr:hypothetical protein [Gammaproteobacteria bacterium]
MHGKNVRAHRAAYMLFVGRIPEGKHVLHRCDNPSCVNPNHLFLGSHLDNMKDKTKKGRAVSLKGIKNPRAKLSEADVREIRARKGTSQVDMAKEFGVSQAKICSVINFTSWKHVN